MDLCAQIIIETSSEDDLLVNIDEISVKQHQLLCLIDQSKWLDDDVICAYICCIRDQVHLQNMDDAKIYFEKPFITRLFKRDGNIGVHEDGTFITEIVRNYLEHEMGLQYHLDILQSQQNFINHNWKDLHVTKWKLREQLQEPIQKDRKVWVQNSKPYSISLTLKKLQEIINDDIPMDIDTFNLVVRKNMFDEIQMVKNQRGMISKHYLDLQFWMITDFGRYPNFRKKLDVERPVDSVRCWPGINYSVASCKLDGYELRKQLSTPDIQGE
ncbi:unnamed protein product [Miscanthus lutarioriparius]|uniref:Uncharacterized protein n=1 Tax=Miscanthus lutarioriparius TaxID=422564 RepID=A0A811SKI3_9POAL|nr:unnamed protein product [Miscanthus lutarioriparius]